MAEVWEEDLMLLYNLENAEIEAQRRPRVFRVREDAFELDEKEFKHSFRLSKELADSLINQLEDVMPPPSRRSALDVESSVSQCCGLKACVQ